MKKKGSEIAAVFVCSPYRPGKDGASGQAELRDNEERVKNACRLLTTLGYMPLAPHGYFPRFLDEFKDTEREQGIALGMEWLEWADELWVFGTRITPGMSREIARATELGIPVRAMPEPSRMVNEYIEAAIHGLPGREEESGDTGGCADEG